MEMQEQLFDGDVEIAEKIALCRSRKLLQNGIEIPLTV